MTFIRTKNIDWLKCFAPATLQIYFILNEFWFTFMSIVNFTEKFLYRSLKDDINVHISTYTCTYVQKKKIIIWHNSLNNNGFKIFFWRWYLSVKTPHTNCGELQLKYLSLYVQSLHQISCKFKYTTLNTKQLLAKISLGSLKVH